MSTEQERENQDASIDVEKKYSRAEAVADDLEYDDPFKWSNQRKWVITVLTACCTLTSTFCSSIFSATIVVTAREFETSETVMLLGVSLFVLGYALGPLLWGPLSELVGRKIPLFSGFFIFAMLQIPIALGDSLAGILICRLLAGCFGAAPIALVSALYADFWDPANRGTATALYSVAAYAGPTLGPVVGAFITESHLGWRWTAWLILILAGVFGIPSFFIVPETYAPVLKERAARRLGSDANTKKNGFNGFVRKYLSKPMMMLLKEPMLDIMTVYISVVYAIMYLTFYAFPYSFSHERGWKAQIGSLPFLSMLVGVLTSCAAVAVYSTRYYQPRLKARGGKVVPEDRLPPIMFGSIVLPIGLFWFAWSSSRTIVWIPQVISAFFIGAGVMLIFTNGIVFLVDIMYKHLGVSWATSLLAFVCVALIPAPFLFYKYGEVLRGKSKFAPSGS